MSWREIPQPAPGKSLAQIAVGGGAYIWGIDRDGVAYRYQINAQSLQYEWVKPVQPPGTGTALQNIAVGNDGQVYAVDTAGNVHMISSGSSPSGPIASQWTPVPGRVLKQISVGNASHIWGVNADGEIFTAVFALPAPGTLPDWQQVDGHLSWVAVSADNTVYGVNGLGDVFKYEGGQGASPWTPVLGRRLIQISVGSRSRIWGVDKDARIYRLVFNPDTSRWRRINGKMTGVSVGADGVVYGVGAAAAGGTTSFLYVE
jgi:virginiamycin B lyase